MSLVSLILRRDPYIVWKQHNVWMSEYIRLLNYMTDLFDQKSIDYIQIPHMHLNISLKDTNCDVYFAQKNHLDLVCFVCFVALRPMLTAMVMAERPVHLTTLFSGQA